VELPSLTVEQIKEYAESNGLQFQFRSDAPTAPHTNYCLGDKKGSILFESENLNSIVSYIGGRSHLRDLIKEYVTNDRVLNRTMSRDIMELLDE